MGCDPLKASVALGLFGGLKVCAGAGAYCSLRTVGGVMALAGLDGFV